MAIKMTNADGSILEFDTVEESVEFLKSFEDKEVVEEATDERKDDVEFKKGDYVRVKNSGMSNFNEGTIGLVIGKSVAIGALEVQALSNNAWKVGNIEYYNTNNNSQFINPLHLERLTVGEAIDVLREETVHEGDYVYVRKADHHGFPEGTIGKVTERYEFYQHEVKALHPVKIEEDLAWADDRQHVKKEFMCVITEEVAKKMLANKGVSLGEAISKESKKETIKEGYEKVSFEDAKEGDIYVALQDEPDITAGKEYELFEDYCSNLWFYDDYEDERKLRNRIENEDGYVIRKKETVETPKFKVGDIVRVTGNTKYAHYHEFGSIGKVVYIDKIGDLKVAVDDIPQFLVAEDVEVISGEKGDPAETPVNKIERGDVVRIESEYTDAYGDTIKKDRLAVVESLHEPYGNVYIRTREGKKQIEVDGDDVQSTLKLVAKACKDSGTIEKGDIVRTKRKVTDLWGDTVKQGRLAVVRVADQYNDTFIIRTREDELSVIVKSSDIELVSKGIE